MALIMYPRYFDTPLKYFPILLMYTFLNELLGAIIRKNDLYNFVWSDFYSTYNVIIYNIYNIVFFLYFYYVFWSYTMNEKYKNFIVIGSILFLITTAINWFVQSYMFEAQAYTYVVGTVILVCCILFYFMDLRSRLGAWFFKQDLLSWISLGILIFYIGYLPIKISRYYNTINGLTEEPYVRRIQILLVLLMYSCFIIGFLRMRRRLPK